MLESTRINAVTYNNRRENESKCPMCMNTGTCNVRVVVVVCKSFGCESNDVRYDDSLRQLSN